MKEGSISHDSAPERHLSPLEALMREFEHQLRTLASFGTGRSEREQTLLITWALDELHLLRATLKHLSASDAIAELQLLMSQIREKFAECSSSLIARPLEKQ